MPARSCFRRGVGLAVLLSLGAAVLALPSCRSTSALELIPDRLVVLTFDDSVKSQFTVVRPALLRRGFSATFFVTEGFDFPTNKTDYMTWDEIAQLYHDGFEIGNHTKSHSSVTPSTLSRLRGEVQAIAERCREHGIPEPISFAYPGNAIAPGALPILRELGIRFARRGGAPERPYEGGEGVPYEPGFDHPLLIPSGGDARPAWKLEDFIRAVEPARDGRIVVLQFHGAPDLAHPWVSTPSPMFEAYMEYLSAHGFHAIAMRDLARYVDPTRESRDPLEAIERRRR